ncbi:MAG: hypothetical protein QOE55_3463 [Acidobacteriaceae bacterium]|nr:hypothetical protein [Acidobacteriaceae bacterium]
MREQRSFLLSQRHRSNVRWELIRLRIIFLSILTGESLIALRVKRLTNK